MRTGIELWVITRILWIEGPWITMPINVSALVNDANVRVRGHFGRGHDPYMIVLGVLGIVKDHASGPIRWFGRPIRRNRVGLTGPHFLTTLDP